MAYRPVRFTVTVRLFIITSFLGGGGVFTHTEASPIRRPVT